MPGPTSRRLRAVALSITAAISLILPMMARADITPGEYREGDESLLALNILPPGQGRHLNALEAADAIGRGNHPSHNTDQIAKYEGLIRAASTLNADNLDDWFTDASFGVKPGDTGRIYKPGGRSGLVVVRDKSKDVPHVYGVTRADTMFGAGYVSGEDRLFAMDALRHLGRGRLSELLGPSASNLASDRAVRLAADYTEEELEAMGQRLKSLEPDGLGEIAEQDLLNYSAGINQYITEALADPSKLPAIYPAIQQLPKLWKPTDSIAIAAYIGGVFSVGGGGQLRNAAFLKKLIDEGKTPAEARAIMEDLRFANDPEAPVSTTETFNFNNDLGPVDPDAVALPDHPDKILAEIGSLPPTFDTPLGPVPLPLAGGGASNALLVTPSLSENGEPLAVFGPQVGYYTPQIFMEIDVHGPGIQARGGAFPGISHYVLIGRGKNYGWSATTAIGDHNDIRAVKLCNTGGGTPTLESDGYLDGTVCKPIYKRTDTWVAKSSAGGTPEGIEEVQRSVISMSTSRTHHGIIQARDTVSGVPSAFVRQRASYGADVDSTLTYVELSDPSKVSGVQDLQHLFSRFNYSFNWHFIAPDGVGFYTSGRYPKLAQGIDPDLPFWGDSRWDWGADLTFEEHPQAFNPAAGYITNWNNKQAPGFRAPDEWWAYGPIGRKQLFNDKLNEVKADGKINMVELVQVMEDGATRDLRGAEVLPYMLDVLGTDSDPRIQGAIDLLRDWSNNGAHRRDLSGDGQYEEQAAVALMDAWWEPTLEAVFRPTLGGAYERMPAIHDDKPGPGGSSYLEGWYGQVQKDLRNILTLGPPAPFSRTYCGQGSFSACRAALRASLSASIATLEADFGSSPSGWEADEDADKIAFSGLDVTGPDPMMWQNRPTFQQVLSF